MAIFTMAYKGCIKFASKNICLCNTNTIVLAICLSYYYLFFLYSRIKKTMRRSIYSWNKILREKWISYHFVFFLTRSHKSIQPLLHMQSSNDLADFSFHHPRCYDFRSCLNIIGQENEHWDAVWNGVFFVMTVMWMI